MSTNQMIYLLQIFAGHPLMECGTRDSDLRILKSLGLITYSMASQTWATTVTGDVLIKDWKDYFI